MIDKPKKCGCCRSKRLKAVKTMLGKEVWACMSCGWKIDRCSGKEV